MNSTELSKATKALATVAGFEMCGICHPGRIQHLDYFRRWLADGRAGSMGYMQNHQGSREDPTTWLPWAKSAVVVGLVYYQPSPKTEDLGGNHRRGKVAMYAWGEDYHLVVRDKLEEVVRGLQSALGRDFQHRVCVDTAAVIERELAAEAGLGWIGKNTMMLNPHWGSFFFLGVLFTDLEMTADAPAVDHCGSCTRCLDVCPTDAFPAAYEMDASRCISYLTIEHRGEIDPELSNKIGEWVYGCDDCQTVCPFNHWERSTSEPRFVPTGDYAVYPDLLKLIESSDTEIRKSNKGKATSRAKPEMWRRNARIVFGNIEPDSIS